MNSIALISAASPKPWWRESMIWLVITGPLAVVLACIVTAIFIYKHPDPPLPASITQMHPADEAAALKQATSVATTPAMTARNHAARPIDPQPSSKP
jgi:hypothetical protein